MVNSCVAANCTNKASLSNGISLHTIPYYNDEQPEAKRRRKIWVDFVKAKRVFEPSNASTLCSAHFRPEDYERRFSILPTQTKPNHLRLKRDDIGICVFPSIQAVPTTSPNEDLQTPRSRCMVSVVNRGLLSLDTEADTKQLHDNTNIPKEQSLPEGYPTRTRNKPSFYRQDKTDDNLSYTIDYCYKLSNIPADYQQAIESPEANKWQEAMDAEMNALIDNDTLELVPCPKDRQIVGAKWVYTIKTGQNEKESYKARFVAKGYSQIPDIDYQETFAPTARMSTIRTLLQHAMQNDLIVHQMDVKTAYLNAPIDREIYIEQPEGYRKSGNSGETLVCKLKRSLYGLKQSGRNWNNLLTA